MGELLKDEYAAMTARHPSIGEARSLGLFSALELVRNRETREPLVPQIDPAFENYGVMKEMFAYMLQRGVVTMTRWNWLMVNPPLTITPEELREGLAVVDEALELADQAMV